MESNIATVPDVPTALPDIEPDDDRENLLAENNPDETEEDLDSDLLNESNAKPSGSRTGKILKAIVGFTAFIFVIGFAVTWFFGMGRFASAKTQPISRSSQKDNNSVPATDDEKLKAALSLVASKEPNPNQSLPSDLPDSMAPDDKLAKRPGQPNDSLVLPDSVSSREMPMTSFGTTTSNEDQRKDAKESKADSVTLPSREKASESERTSISIEPVGRSLFFGATKASRGQTREPETKPLPKLSDSQRASSDGEIPFGTLLPVRLIGAIYTLKKSGGMVRMELTQPIEGKGYSYPAGTTIVGNLRGGESNRAFVNVVGLIDPTSGGFMKFTGELIGGDGASGINGNRKRMTGKWSRFFNGLKETAGSILGSVGSMRSGRTVVLSEPLRRGSEKLSEDTSSALFGGENEDTFLEVLAGTTGYVLVTQLPEATSTSSQVQTGVDQK